MSKLVTTHPGVVQWPSVDCMKIPETCLRWILLETVGCFISPGQKAFHAPPRWSISPQPRPNGRNTLEKAILYAFSKAPLLCSYSTTVRPNFPEKWFLVFFFPEYKQPPYQKTNQPHQSKQRNKQTTTLLLFLIRCQINLILFFLALPTISNSCYRCCRENVMGSIVLIIPHMASILLTQQMQ